MASAPKTLTRWERMRNVGVVGVLALGFALTLAIFAEANYARPHCTAYGAARQLTYGGLAYASAPLGMPGRRPPSCLFVSAQRHVVGVPFAQVAPSRWTAILVDVATTPLLTTPVILAAFVFGLFQLYGALGIAARQTGERPEKQ